MNGPVTQRQARRGGALAPAHATGEGAPGHSGGKPGVMDRTSPKAAAAELEALGRHLCKGMPLAEWVTVNVPGHVMAAIAQDLESGLSASYAVKSALASLPKAQPPAQSRQQAAQRRTQAQIAAQFQARLTAAFGTALAAAKALIAAWVAGTLAVTAAVLAAMILAEIRKALLEVLTRLWTAAWEAAEASEGLKPDRAALEAFLASWGANWIQVISATGEQAIVDAINAALRDGDPAVILAAVENLLSEARAEQITVSEMMRAWNAAIEIAMRAAGIAYKRWVTSGLPDTCAACLKNQAQGSVPMDKPFSSGKMRPLEHPHCRCHLAPGAPPPSSGVGKVLRREVGLNGQETWTEFGEQPDYSGGRVFQPHRADGAQGPGWSSPGAMTGGEPPRWDGSEPAPVVERAPDADDDAAYGSAEGIGARPGTYWPAPYMDGWWPSPHGHGMTQPGTSSPGAANGRLPNGVGKRNAAAKFLEGAPEARPAAVFRLMQQNFPPSALKWVRKLRWVGPVDIPFGLMDTANRDSWAASHEQDHVDDLAGKLRANQHVNPIIGVIRPGHNHVRLIDGRHRTLAAEKAGKPVRGYVGYLDDANEQAAYDTYLKQFHSGDDPRNKSFTAGNLGLPGNVSGLTPLTVEGQRTGPSVAGLAVRAADTGRVLMLQRSITPSDPAAGMWEWPGGHAEQGESLLAAALREWAEETGRKVPQGQVTGHWDSGSGVYRGFVLTIPHEADVDLSAARQVANPDGDAFEAVAFWDPAMVDGNPAVRPELRADWPRVMGAMAVGAAKSARTPMLEVTPRMLGPEGLWHTPDRHVGGKQKLPDYIEQVAGALMDQQGMGESEAIATAINAIKRWAAGTCTGATARSRPSSSKHPAALSPNGTN